MAKPPQTFEYRFDDSVGYLLARARLKLAREVDERLAAFDITPTQAGILLMLSSGRFDNAAGLARELYTDSAAMTRMVDRLEKRGLIRRVRREDDRRAIRLEVTPEGIALSKRLPAVMAAAHHASFGSFSGDELDTLRALLRKFLADDQRAASMNDEHENR